MKYPYPIKFHPVYKDYLWGGTGFAQQFGRDLPGDVIAESWEIAAHPNGTSVVANGELAGRTLPELMKMYGRDLMGNGVDDEALEKFPLLLKFLDANKYLSVQVHPDDDYALKHEGEYGKTEAWYVLAARQGAQLVYGLKEGVDKERFAQAIADGRVEDCLRQVEVKPGDMLVIPPGLVHSLGAGVMVAEIQQNSDTVYRVYDWNRVDASGKPRQLHIDKALEVIDFDLRPEIERGVDSLSSDRCRLVSTEYFIGELLTPNSEITEEPDGRRFVMISIIEGTGTIRWQSRAGQGELEFSAGTSLLIPASIDSFSLSGSCRALEFYVPLTE